MATTFSGTNLEQYQISDFDQLVGIRSNTNRDLVIRTTTYDISDAVVKSIQVYNKSVENGAVIISLPFKVLNSASSKYSSAVISSDEIIRLLNAFGFNVAFGEKVRLSVKTLNFLKSLYNIGYQYMKFTESGIYFYLSSLDEGQLGDKFNGFHDCDFSPLDTKEIYNISHLIDKVTIKWTA